MGQKEKETTGKSRLMIAVVITQYIVNMVKSETENKVKKYIHM